MDSKGRRALPYECAHHPPRFPIRATAITDVECNCAGSPPINGHTHHGQHKDAVHSPTSVRTIICASQSELLPSLLSNATVLVITHQLTHPSWTAQGRRALPYECAHHPLRFPI